MAKLTTQHAIRRLLHNEDYLNLWLESGYTKIYRRKCRYKLKKQELSANVQREILRKCGFSLVIEERWDIPLWV